MTQYSEELSGKVHFPERDDDISPDIPAAGAKKFTFKIAQLILGYF